MRILCYFSLHGLNVKCLLLFVFTVWSRRENETQTAGEVKEGQGQRSKCQSARVTSCHGNRLGAVVHIDDKFQTTFLCFKLLFKVVSALHLINSQDEWQISQLLWYCNGRFNTIPLPSPPLPSPPLPSPPLPSPPLPPLPSAGGVWWIWYSSKCKASMAWLYTVLNPTKAAGGVWWIWYSSKCKASMAWLYTVPESNKSSRWSLMDLVHMATCTCSVCWAILWSTESIKIRQNQRVDFEGFGGSWG